MLIFPKYLQAASRYAYLSTAPTGNPQLGRCFCLKAEIATGDPHPLRWGWRGGEIVYFTTELTIFHFSPVHKGRGSKRKRAVMPAPTNARRTLPIKTDTLLPFYRLYKTSKRAVMPAPTNGSRTLPIKTDILLPFYRLYKTSSD